MKRDVRYLALDTETTGLSASGGDRLVEIGMVEFMNGIVTGKSYHSYFDPCRDMPDEAFGVHGLSEKFLSDKPKFAEKYVEILEFCEGYEIVIHNANFDLDFLDAELARVGQAPFRKRFSVTDSLRVAQRKYPNAKTTLDALCSRLGVDNSERTKEGGKHGAILDCELLAQVFMKMAGADGLAYAFEMPKAATVRVEQAKAVELRVREPLGGGAPLPEELERHAYLIGKIKNPLWAALSPAA